MKTKDDIYCIPNLGCLLGLAYQTEISRLNAALTAAATGITPAEYLILRILYTRGAIQQCDISRILGKDKASVSRSIHSLEKKGLVNSDAVSYKCCMVSLTGAGESLEPDIMDIAQKCHHDIAARLTTGQMDTLREILVRIID